MDKKEAKKQKLMEDIEFARQTRDLGWPTQHWRAWGSWFSWGSPVGLGLFFLLTALSIGGFIWLINL